MRGIGKALQTEILSEDRVLSKKPHGAIRVKYALLFFSLMMIVYYYVFPRKESLSYSYMALFCCIALAVTFSSYREIWSVKSKPSPRWIAYVTIFGSAAVILTLLVLHELNLFRWNHLYFEWPFGLVCAVISVCAWITEWRKPVRVYVVVEGIVFVSQE